MSGREMCLFASYELQDIHMKGSSVHYLGIEIFRI